MSAKPISMYEQFQYICEKGYLLTVFSDPQLFENYKGTLKHTEVGNHNFSGDDLQQIMNRMYEFVCAEERSKKFRGTHG